MDYMLALGRMFLIAVTEHQTDQLAAGKGNSWLSFRDSQGEGSHRVGCNLAPWCLHHPVSLLCVAEGAHSHSLASLRLTALSQLSQSPIHATHHPERRSLPANL